ncbi:autotransporter assembly complex protein TamA [Fundidesulfovibrio soli]|uniref:autotransporter assembly complex protein TamA n=1 Tax=Fundidesulfovibrio soli TaxID=2922716 RepID=UPI001FAEC37E
MSDTASKADKPPASLFLLKGRARGDLKKLKDAMASRGYFAAQVSYSIDDSTTPVQVRFTVDPGGAFLLKWVDVELSEGSEPVRFTLPEASELGLALEAPAVSKDIVNADDKVVSIFKNRGHPFASLSRRKAVADPQALTLHVTYVVTPGPYCVFGPTALTGLKDVKERLLLPLIPWKEGDEYNQEKVDLFQQRLADLGLFAKATAAPKILPKEPGRVEVEAQVTERKPRTFKGGVTYNTDDGPGAQVNWEHRNLFGNGERLKLHLAVSQVSKVFEANFENPFFLDQRQRLLAGVRAADENTKAYHGQNATGELKISRKLGEQVSAQVGLGYRSSLVYDDAANPSAVNTRYNLASVPLGLSADTRDDPLNPSRGWMFAVNATPWVDAQGTNLNFVKAVAAGSHYLRLLEKPSLILATRASLGTISGVSASRLLPPDIRFYAGGSGSIRGYAYQSAGPLRGDKPLGGRSIFDFGTELRIRLTEMFGLVFFMDGGNAFEAEYPEPGKGLLLGAGTGLRVFTPIGPFRVDVATPLNRRRNVDDVFQLYISLGQAF